MIIFIALNIFFNLIRNLNIFISYLDMPNFPMPVELACPLELVGPMTGRTLTLNIKSVYTFLSVGKNPTDAYQIIKDKPYGCTFTRMGRQIVCL